MATVPGPMYKFPWEDWSPSVSKYWLYAPFAAVALLGYDDADNWCWHMCLLVVLRYLHAQAWVIASRSTLFEDKRVYPKPLEFKQVDRENNWDDYIILQAYTMTAVHWLLPGFHSFPLCDTKGLLHLLLLHAGPGEFIYYWFHRALHHHSLYAAYHSHHHASFVTEPISGSCHPLLEHIGYTANFAVPMLGVWALGTSSMATFYAYLLGFDFLNCWGHCNFEIIPFWLFDTVPGLKYLLYTPSYHSLHHTHVRVNYCLFMPIYDYMYGTMDPKSDALHESAWAGGRGQVDQSPDVVFLAHGTELLSVFHLPFVSRSFSSQPFKAHWFLWPLWPVACMIFLALRVLGSTFTASKARLRGLSLHVKVVPAWGLQYFIKSEYPRINGHIERAIRQADADGTKVIGLGALNKAEFLNAGGSLFTEKMKDLRVRVVHGNTLTTAVMLKMLPAGLPEVFLTGATSKIGKACALYLSARGCTVHMLTPSQARFEAVVEAAGEGQRGRLVRATDCSAGARVKHWLVGKPLSRDDQAHAPEGCTFHQFVVPPIDKHRADCTYGPLPGMVLPDDTLGVHTAMMDMERRCVYACYAGAILHGLEGWTHHEVGAIDHTLIDKTWDAAVKHGFKMPAEALLMMEASNK